MRRMKNLKAVGNAIINGETYYFLGKNIQIKKETVDFYGKDNFFSLLDTDGKTPYVFIKTDAAGPIPAKQILDWHEPTFIIKNKKGKKGEYEYIVYFK